MVRITREYPDLLSEDDSISFPAGLEQEILEKQKQCAAHLYKPTWIISGNTGGVCGTSQNLP